MYRKLKESNQTKETNQTSNNIEGNFDQDEPPQKTYNDICPGYTDFGKSKKKKLRLKLKEQLREVNKKLREEWEK